MLGPRPRVSRGRHPNGKRPQTQRREQDSRKCDPVAEQNGDAVTAREPQLRQSDRPPTNDLLKKAIGEAIFSANDGFPVGVGADSVRQKGKCAFRSVGEAAHDATVEVPFGSNRWHGSKPWCRHLQRLACRVTHASGSIVGDGWELTSTEA
jgi:hypothetical protein